MGERDKSACTEVIEDESRLGPIAEEGGQGEHTGVRGAHDRTVGRQNGGAIGDRNSALKVCSVSTSDERRSGTGIKDDRWRGWDYYSR